MRSKWDERAQREGTQAAQFRSLVEKGSGGTRQNTVSRLPKECLEPLMGQSYKIRVRNSGGKPRTGKSYSRYTWLWGQDWVLVPLLLGRTVLPLDRKQSSIIIPNHAVSSLHAYLTSCPTRLICCIKAGTMFNSFLNLSTLHGSFGARYFASAQE